MRILESELLKVIVLESPIFEKAILKKYDLKPGRRRDEKEIETITHALCNLEDNSYIELDSDERWTVKAKS